jgi:RNA recognition motif-containing protein
MTTGLFCWYGSVSEIFILKKGAAFVKFNTAAEADAAISAVNGLTLPGTSRPLVVRRAGHTGGSEASRALVSSPAVGIPESAAASSKVFVGALPQSATEYDLLNFFSQYGPINEVFIMRRPDGISKGAAFVKYISRASAVTAIETLDRRVTMPGALRPLTVKFAESSAEGAGAKALNVRQPVVAAAELTRRQLGGVKVFVGALPAAATEVELAAMFQPFGTTLEIFVMKNADGSSKGACSGRRLGPPYASNCYASRFRVCEV